MKNTKKFAAMIAALTLSACSVAPMFSSAAYIQIKSGAEATITHTYEAYQIFSGDLNDGTLSNIKWGSGINHVEQVVAENDGKTIYDALAEKEIKKVTKVKGDGFKSAFDAWIAEEDNAGKKEEDYLATLDETVEDVVTVTKTACTSAEEVAAAISGAEDDSQIAKDFAKVVAGYLSTTKTLSDADGKIDVGDAVGYYLVQDAVIYGTGEDADKVVDSPSGMGSVNSDAKTRFILKVLGEVTDVNAKSSAPSVVKKVKENTDVSDYSYTYGVTEDSEGTTIVDDDYNDVADYNIGDVVPFKLYGTLPSTYEDYDHYFYQFNDTLGPEFDLDMDSIEIAVNGTPVNVADAGTDISITRDNGNKNKFYITIEDVKEIAPNASDIITVAYNATLNENAKIGRPGQVNRVDLTYSSNPNENYVPEKNNQPNKPGDTGTTVEDTVIVFTYEVDATKVIKGTTTPLENAKFYLYKKNADGTRSYYAGKKAVWMDVSGEKPVEVEDQTSVTEETETIKKVTQSVWTDAVSAGEDDTFTAPATAEQLVSNAQGKFIVEGIDEGTYKLSESDAPAGYNKLNDDITLVVTANTLDEATDEVTEPNRQDWQFGNEDNQGELALLDLSIKVDEEDTRASTDTNKGIVDLTVENSRGSELPSTGGIGTTLFYLGGGAMVAVAGVFLITKKRMGKQEN